MTTQPKALALELAGRSDPSLSSDDLSLMERLEIAAELRRLHAVETMSHLARAGHEQWFAECQRLHALNAELVDALLLHQAAGVGNSTDFSIQRKAHMSAINAIAKAQEQQ